MAQAMAPAVPGGAGEAVTTVAAPPWPAEGAGWFALFVIVLTMFLTFFDQTVFAMLAEKMRAIFMWRAIRPYGEEVARLEALGR